MSYTSGTALVTLKFSGDGGSGIAKIVSVISSTEVRVEVEADQNFKNVVDTRNWQEGEFSDHRGWPSAVAFHDGRLFWAREDKFRGSESDDFTAFNLETDGDSGSIQRSIATTGAVFTANWMLSLTRLVIGTDGAEVSARSNAFDEPLTPTNIGLKNASTVGAASISPVRVNSRGFFVARSQVRIYQIEYNFDVQDYESFDITELHEDLGVDHSNFVELAVQRHPQPMVWSALGDGQVGILLHSPRQQISGWIRLITDGQVESLVVYPATGEDRVYLWVKRTVNGATVRYREKVALTTEAIGAATTKLADAGVFAAGPVSSVTAAHLANKTGLVGWGTTTGSVKTVLTGLSANASGVISLGATYTSVFVGLPYTGKYKSAKLAYGAERGTALLQTKHVSQIGLLVADTHRDAISAGPSFSALTSYKLASDSGAALSSTSLVKENHDDRMVPFGGAWNTDSRVCIQVAPGHPATLLGLVTAVQTNER